MVIAKVKGGYVILHSGKPSQIGQRVDSTKKPLPLKKIQKMHAAIIISKIKRKAKISNKNYKSILKKKGWIKKKYWEKK